MMEREQKFVVMHCDVLEKLHYEKFSSKNCLIETDAGLIDVEFNNDSTVSVDIGSPKFKWKDIPLIKEMDGFNLGFDFSYLKMVLH